jgi:hypothetical protein
MPPLVMGVAVLWRTMRSPVRWLLLIVAQCWLVATFTLILYTFLASLAPLYEYQPLD